MIWHVYALASSYPVSLHTSVSCTLSTSCNPSCTLRLPFLLHPGARRIDVGAQLTQVVQKLHP